MASKKSKQGLGEPTDVSVNHLFDVEEPEAVDQRPPVETKPVDKDLEGGKVKTSLMLSPQTLDLLLDLKKEARKLEGRFVSQSELVDWAVRDLAMKLKVLDSDGK